MPKRIQMTRQRPWRADYPDAVIVARPSKWGNPFRIRKDRDAARAVAMFRELLESDQRARARVAELAGRDLACWCRLDQACHADVLLEIANPPSPESVPGDTPTSNP